MLALYPARDFLWVVVFVNILVRTSNAHAGRTSSTNDRCPVLPEVTILQGTLQGIILQSNSNKSFAAFQGIPYAKPPIGNLRFRSPVAPDAWEGTLHATRGGNSCPQLAGSKVVGDEDCLYLNVYTPKLSGRNSLSLLPVMVWIHGGGFQRGNGNFEFHGPRYILEAEVVLVCMNYRLGILGFLSTGDEVAPGNWGLKDQVQALRWVKENILHFGGDPNQVTVFGESAGAASVQLLALSNLTTGLFHKYISQSGAPFGFWMYRPRATYPKAALHLGRSLGCPTNTSSLLVDCLREFSVSEIMNMEPHFHVWHEFPLVPWAATDEPDIEGALLTDSPVNLFDAGKIHDLPSITGVTRDEGFSFSTSYFPGSDAFDDLLKNFDDLLPIILQYSDSVKNVTAFTAALKKYYFNNDLTTDKTLLWTQLAILIGDSYFKYPVYDVVKRRQALAKSPTYFYSFEYRGTFGHGNKWPTSEVMTGRVVHSDDLIYLFPQIEPLYGALPQDMSETDLQMVDTIVQLWTSFAINGTPTSTTMKRDTAWAPYSSDDNYLRIGNGPDGALEPQCGFLQERMQFWKNLSAISWSLSLNCDRSLDTAMR